MKKSMRKDSCSEAAPTKKSQVDYDQEVNRRAYELWEATGGQHGDDLRHWLQAEREVRDRHNSAQ